LSPLKIGLFGIGLDAYWPQFPGLKERLESYLQRVQHRLEHPGVVVVNLGLIDTPERAFEAGHAFRQADVDLIFLHLTTYALSSTVLPVVRRARVPVLILNLQPGPAIDYAEFNRMNDRTRMTGEWLAYCAACPVPEIASVFNRARIPFHQVTGMLDDDPTCWDAVAEWMGAGNPANEDAISSIILGTSLLTGRGIPAAGEMEIKNVQAMKILDTFGAGGSFTEYYALDYHADVVLMGHDGPGHIAIAEGKTKVRPLKVYHGKIGRGLSVEMSVRHGPVTLLSVVQTTDGRLDLQVAEGESVPGPILEIGNTNSRYRFSLGARRFVEEWNRAGPAHHCAVGVGHLASKIEKLGSLPGLKTTRVC